MHLLGAHVDYLVDMAVWTCGLAAGPWLAYEFLCEFPAFFLCYIANLVRVLLGCLDLLAAIMLCLMRVTWAVQDRLGVARERDEGPPPLRQEHRRILVRVHGLAEEDQVEHEFVGTAAGRAAFMQRLQRVAYADAARIAAQRAGPQAAAAA